MQACRSVIRAAKTHLQRRRRQRALRGVRRAVRDAPRGAPRAERAAPRAHPYALARRRRTQSTRSPSRARRLLRATVDGRLTAQQPPGCGETPAPPRRRAARRGRAAAERPGSERRGISAVYEDVRPLAALTRVAAAPKRLPGRAACPPPRAWRVCRPRGWPARAAGARCPRPPPCGAAAAQRRSASSPPPPPRAAVRRPAVPAAASSACNALKLQPCGPRCAAALQRSHAPDARAEHSAYLVDIAGVEPPSQARGCAVACQRGR